MADYAYIQNHSKRGALGLSRRVLEQIAYKAMERVQGAKLDAKMMKSPFTLLRPIKVILHHNGMIDMFIEVTILKGNDVKKVCENIQKEIKELLEASVEQVKVNIVTRVLRIEK